MKKLQFKPYLVGAVLLLCLLSLLGSQLACSDPVPVEEGWIKVHFIDVGQGDSILVQSAQATLLIDGGTNQNAQKLLEYLRQQGVDSLTGVIATHPHEDHIGGLDTVIQAIPTQNVYLPNASHTSQTFADFIAAVQQSGAKRIQAQPGVSVDLEDLHGVFLGPIGSYSGDLNNQSAVFKLTHGSIEFLFTGDVEAQAEKDLVQKWSGHMQAEVLKVAHHGSSTSSTEAFLAAVNPKYAVISCGKDNTYGHPHQETLAKLRSAGIQTYRTDQLGTVLLESNGREIQMMNP